MNDEREKIRRFQKKGGVKRSEFPPWGGIPDDEEEESVTTNQIQHSVGTGKKEKKID